MSVAGKRALARAEAGAEVTICGRRPEPLQALASPALAYRTANAFNDPRDGHRHCYLPQDYGPVPGAVTIIPTGNGAASPRLRFVR